MNAFKMFFGEFWPIFIGGTIGFSMAWLVRGHLLFVGPKSFTELANFTKDEQKRLLVEASKEGFCRWRSFVPVVVFTAIFSCGIALGRTLPKVIISFPDSFWVHILFAMLFAIVGGSLADLIARHFLRPYLKKCIERIAHAA
jgi:hypothetical protein